MEQKNDLKYLNLIRAFAVISLVVWHSYCSYVCWGFGNSPLDKIYYLFIVNLIPDANMPLFTFISGFLFSFLLVEKNKYKQLKPFLKIKSERLIIPFLVLGAFTLLTERNIGIVECITRGGGNSHLWYCLMLFYVFIADWFLINS